MIIVGQDKNVIANFDNITSLDIFKADTVYVIECNFTNKNSIYLGEYSTEERAKEVLFEIKDKQEKYWMPQN